MVSIVPEGINFGALVKKYRSWAKARMGENPTKQLKNAFLPDRDLAPIMKYMFSLVVVKSHERGYASLNSRMLQEISRVMYSMKLFLVEKGYIDCDRYYIEGKKNYYYTVSAKYRNREIKVRDIKDPYMLKRLNKIHRRKVEGGLAGSIDSLEMDFERAEEVIAKQFMKGHIDADQATSMYLSVDKFKRGDIFAERDNFSGRLHTNATNMASILRESLTIDGKPLANVDVKNSQMLCLSLIFDPETRHKVVDSPFIKQKIPYTEDVALFIEKARSGQVYEDLMEMLLESGRRKRITRKEAKILMIKWLFTRAKDDRSWKKSPIRYTNATFREYYPYIHKGVNALRWDSTSDVLIAKLLQEAEVKVFLEGCGKAFSDAGIDFVTIHDSALVPQSKAQITKGIIEDTYREFGTEVTVEIENYPPNWVDEGFRYSEGWKRFKKRHLTKNRLGEFDRQEQARKLGFDKIAA